MFPELTRDEVFMIGTQRLWLRWPRFDDAERFAAINGHADVASMTASWPVGCDAVFARERIAKMRDGNAAGKHLTLAIAQRGDWFGTIGVLGIGLQTDAETGETKGQIGYAVDPAAAGQGVMTEALDGLIGMARRLTRIHRIGAGVMPNNAASMRVLKKCGFTRGKPYVHDSSIKGPIDVIRFTRVLRTSSPSLTRPSRAMLSLPRPERTCA